MKIHETKHGIILGVTVKPRSKGFRILADENEIVVFCREEPIKGKVNKELIRELSKLFQRKVELVSGFASKQKRLLICHLTKQELLEKLGFTDFQETL